MHPTAILTSADLTHCHSSYGAHLLLECVQDAINEQLLQARINVRRAQVLHHLQEGAQQQDQRYIKATATSITTLDKHNSGDMLLTR